MRVLKIIVLVALVTMYSCQNNTIVLTERIEMKIDNTIVDFNNNIEAKLILLPASTGSPNYFRLTAEDNSSNTFMITNLFPVLGVTPVVPSSGAIQAPESNFISVFGLDVDDGNAGNNLVYSVTAFGLEGEQIEATISGTYYDNLNVQHTLFIIIDVTRDQ